MNDQDETNRERGPIDAKYCPSCGESLPLQSVQIYADNLLNRYRASFRCPECGYAGEVIREGGLEDISLNMVKNDGNPLAPTPGDDSV